MENMRLKFSKIYWPQRNENVKGTLDVDKKRFVLSKETGTEIIQVNMEEIEGITWTKMSKSNHELSLDMKGSRKQKFHGFSDKDKHDLSRYLENYTGTTPQTKERAISGKYEGQLNMTGETASFLVDGKKMFDLPVGDMSGTSASWKQVSIDFPEDESIPPTKHCELVNVKFETRGPGSVGRAKELHGVLGEAGVPQAPKKKKGK